MFIGKEFKFDAAHSLPKYKGKCNQLHGHTWTVTVEVEGDVDPDSGMVLDLNALSTIIHACIDIFDHQNLNQYFDNPTCENITEYIVKKLTEVLFSMQTICVKVQEGTGGWAFNIKRRVAEGVWE